MKNFEALEPLETAAAEQWGIITTAQAQREGISRLQLGRLADKNTLMRVRRGIYLLPSAQHGSSLDIRVAWVVFLQRVFTDSPNPMDWVLKGGTVLLIRNGYGRFTQDIDLARAKICAMYETHHGKSSNRFHDLADIVQIVCTQNFSVATSPVQLS